MNRNNNKKNNMSIDEVREEEKKIQTTNSFNRFDILLSYIQPLNVI